LAPASWAKYGHRDGGVGGPFAGPVIV
jgi:hypothetical protein